MREWTTTEGIYVRAHASEGAEAVAAGLESRSVWAVKQFAYRERISLRQSGSRRGLILGQPRDESLRKDIRDLILNGRLDAEVLDARLKLDQEADLCPCCGRRPVRVRSSGFCKVCHVDRQAFIHLEALAETEARRRAWAARQASSRSRRRLNSEMK